VTDVYAAIEAITGDGTIPTATICDSLGVCRSAYYTWLVAEPTARQRELDDLTPSIVAIFWQHRRRYGARRIAEELKDRKIACSAKRVAKVLRMQGLRALQPKSFVPRTTDSRHGLGYSPNLLLDAPEPTRVDELWVADITYLPLRGGGFCYLAGVMDRFSRDIVGWSVSSSMAEALVLVALRQAIHARQPPVGLIHHSDRGGQYAGSAYRAVLRRAGMRQSMSRPDNCYDNAFMESCWGTFKLEMEMTEYDSEAAARKAVAEYVRYYRFERKHSSIGYLTPHQFATRTMAKT
jgi:transposase InsO family protein